MFAMSQLFFRTIILLCHLVERTLGYGYSCKTMVFERRLRPVCLPGPKIWSLNLRPITSRKHHAGAGRDPGGVATALVDATDACSAAARSPA
uniref:Putative secreted protein n=1 Tax=Ixodes ricinus TaxID=34613 RepID=A0A6B0UBZ6_IXORI